MLISIRKEGEEVYSRRSSRLAKGAMPASRRCSTAQPVSPGRVLWTDCVQASAPQAPAEERAVVEQAIERAEQALAGNLAPELLDYHAYLLYLALNGSDEDIGARFAGFRYPGLRRQ